MVLDLSAFNRFVFLYIVSRVHCCVVKRRLALIYETVANCSDLM